MRRERERITPAPAEDLALLRKFIAAMMTPDMIVVDEASMLPPGAWDTPAPVERMGPTHHPDAVTPADPAQVAEVIYGRKIKGSNRHQRRAAKHVVARRSNRQPKGFRPKEEKSDE